MKVRIMVTLKQPLTMNVVPAVASLDVLKIIGVVEGVASIEGQATEKPNWSKAYGMNLWQISPEKVLSSQHADWIDFGLSSMTPKMQFIPTSAILAWEYLEEA